MANLAIKGHATRGKEVIEILKTLGWENVYKLSGTNEECAYYEKNGVIHNTSSIGFNNIKLFTLEEFLEEFPYKVGDKVKSARINDVVGKITHARWDNYEEQIVYTVEWDDVAKSTLTYFARGLQPYKEETMEGVYAYNEINCYHQDFGDKVRIRLGNDFEIKVEDRITYIVKKQPRYPKTYEECCNILMGKTNFQDFLLVLTKLSTNINEENSISPEPPHITLINNFYKLLVCRDAYWKIAGEEMGLGKSWEPDWENVNEYKYGLFRLRNIIYKDATCINPTLLIFPTKEMRDAFYENFKELIKACKELL